MRALNLTVCVGSLAVLLNSGCAQNQFDDSPALPPSAVGPGTEVWADARVQCDDDSQCGKFESCLDGVCQMKRCGDEVYRSAAPLGVNHYLASRRDVIVAYQGTDTSQPGVAGFQPKSNAFVRPTKTGLSTQWSLSGTAPVDVTGGNLMGAKPEAVAVATAGSSDLTVMVGTEKFKVPVGFVPIAITAGDVSGDGIDEVVALSSNGLVAVCTPKIRECIRATFAHSWIGQDVTVGDVDGDGFNEPVFLVKEGGTQRIVVWNADYQGTVQKELISMAPPESLNRITAGDFNGDGVAEIAGLHDRGFRDVPNDELFVFGLSNSTLTTLGSFDVNGNAVDIAAGDTDGRDSNVVNRAELAVLDDSENKTGEQNKVEIFRTGSSNPAAMTSVFRSGIENRNVKRIALFDLDGDSPLGRLIDGPRMIPGEMVPIAALAFPPFSRQFSEGIASVSLGNGSSTSTSHSESISMGLGVSAGFGYGLGTIFGTAIGASHSISLSRDISRSKSTSEGVSVGSSFSFGSRVERYGSEYAGIVVACGCFHAYTYRLEDPDGTIQGASVGGQSSSVDGETFTVYVPVGGQTTLWSSLRYNAMARALGKLPIVEVNHQVGNAKSYPSTMVDLQGNPIDPKDFVFPSPPTFRTSDIGQVGWSLGADTSTTNGTSMSRTIGVGTTLTIGPANVGVSGSIGWSEGNSITVGNSISFSGNVPGIPDDPATPEDEYQVHQFAFTPYVYQAHYKDKDNEDAAYYVLNYMVRN